MAMPDAPNIRSYQDAHDFVGALFAHAEDGYVAASWWPPNGDEYGDHTFRPADQALDLLADAWNRANGRADLYVRLTTIDHVETGNDGEPRRGWRGKAGDTLHGYALPFDLDMSDGWSPATAAQFFDLIENANLRPSVIVNSGHGWHGYYLYDEALDAADHGLLLARARATFIRIASTIGLKPDTSVYDVSRVMRIPGSINVKKHGAHVVSAIDQDRTDFARRYGWSHLDEHLDPPAPAAITRSVAGGENNDGTPGRDFRARVDALDVLRRFMPGVTIYESPETGDVYVTRGDRTRHGIVRYGDDGHVAIYSSTTVHVDLGVPAGNPDDRAAPWWSDQLLAFFAYGGDFAKMASDLAAGRGPDPWTGQTFGAERPGHTAEDVAAFLDAHRHAEPPRTLRDVAPGTAGTSAPDTATMGAEDDEWGPGAIELAPLMEALGFHGTKLGASGKLIEFRSPLIAWGKTPCASTLADGSLRLADNIRTLPGWETAPVGTPLGWRDVLRAAFGTPAPKAWRRLIAGDPQALDLPILAAIRQRAYGVEGLDGDGTDRPWKFSTLRNHKSTPAPEPTFLCRTPDGKGIVYDKSLNVVYGASESGKTWLLVWMVMQAVRRGKNAAWFDVEEPYRPQIDSRARDDFGATDDELDRIHIPEIQIPEMIGVDYGARFIRRTVVEQLVAYVVDNDIALVVIDSLSELAGTQNLDDNRKQDMAYLRANIITELTRVCAVVMIDHTNHTSGAREGGSAYKRSTLDGTAIYVRPERPFIAGQGGSAIIHVMKDRHGRVRPDCHHTNQRLDVDGPIVPVDIAGRFTLAPRALHDEHGTRFEVEGTFHAYTEEDARHAEERAVEREAKRAAGKAAEIDSPALVRMKLNKVIAPLLKRVKLNAGENLSTTKLIQKLGNKGFANATLDLLADKDVKAIECFEGRVGKAKATFWRVVDESPALIVDSEGMPTGVRDDVITDELLMKHGFLVVAETASEANAGPDENPQVSGTIYAGPTRVQNAPDPLPLDDLL